MIRIQDILSLTEFHRHSREHIEQLRSTGRPAVLTVNGRAALVVQHATAYQELLDRVGNDRSAPSCNAELARRAVGTEDET